MARRAARAAEKIRGQGLVSSRVIGFAHGSDRRPNPPSGQRSTKLSPPTNDSRVIVAWAVKMMEHMYERGGVYTKCGVLLEDLTPAGREQTDLFRPVDPRAAGVMAAMDGLNSRFGRDTCVLASQGLGARKFDTKREMKSPCWTTRLSEVPVCR